MSYQVRPASIMLVTVQVISLIFILCAIAMRSGIYFLEIGLARTQQQQQVRALHIMKECAQAASRALMDAVPTGHRVAFSCRAPLLPESYQGSIDIIFEHTDVRIHLDLIHGKYRIQQDLRLQKV